MEGGRQQEHLVRCDFCGEEIKVKVGWQPYDEAVWGRFVVRTDRRKGALMRWAPGAGTQAGGWEMKIPLRVRWCGDHAVGTEGCRGRLWRVK